MAFLCQRQPYLKTFTTKILTSEPSKYKGRELFKTILEETIFFPEGGGQPCDIGTINDARVEFVVREKSQAVIYCDQKLEVGSNARCILDWKRRFDHMQQHTAQHLLSAILENKYGINTTSWELGSEYSNVEIDTSANPLTSDIRTAVEEELNSYIRDRLSVRVQCLSLSEADKMIRELSRRGIPEDVAEPVRIVQIEGVDANMCCGTHVENLAHIQSVYLLHETLTRGITRLYFIAGDRCLRHFKSILQRENAVTSLIGNGPSQHVEVIENMRKNQKQSESELKYAIKEMAMLDSVLLSEKLRDEKFVFLHREFNSMLYINTVSKLISNYLKNNQDKVVVLVSGGPRGPGMFCLLGPVDSLKLLEPIILKTLDGKGSIVKGRLQGKANKIENHKKLYSETEKLLSLN